MYQNSEHSNFDRPHYIRRHSSHPHGPRVIEIQERLRQMHRRFSHPFPDPGPSDGVYGPTTEHAVRVWQQFLADVADPSLAKDGCWGPLTEAATAQMDGIVRTLATKSGRTPTHAGGQSALKTSAGGLCIGGLKCRDTTHHHHSTVRSKE